MTNSSREASCLIYKALSVHNSPASDAEYRELLARYRADKEFAEQVHGVAAGLQLTILDVSERGLVIAPNGKESRFAIRLSDMRKSMNEDQKVALVLAHLAIGAVFFPTTDFLEDEGRTPFPATLGQMRDKLTGVTQRLSEAADSDDYPTEELRPGWSLLKSLPTAIPEAERASLSSVEGIVRLVLNRMLEYGLVRKEDKDDIDEKATFTPTHQLRVQLRELTLPRLFQATIQAASAE